jgi:competence protein ComGC
MEPQTDPTNLNPEPQNPEPIQTVTPTPTVSAPFAPAQPQPMVLPQQMPVPQPYAQPLPEAPVNTPGQIVLQWLTYAFWGWTILGMSALTISVLANFISKAETGGFTPYGIAAVLVLLPISIVCDVFYSKHEPEKKTGAASIVMVIHAVIFAIFGIGSVIAIVFSIVSMLTSSSDSSSTQVALYSAMIISVLYAAAFLRTINPVRIPMVRRSFTIFMTLVVGVIAILGIVGPVANERSTRNDRLITSNLSSVKASIDSYANSKNKLPSSLNDLNLSGDAKKLVDTNQIKYTANSKPVSTTSTSTGTTRKTLTTNTTYYYELCVNYTKASDKNRYSTYASSREDSDGYSTYIESYYHDAGEECYKIKTVDYNYSY